MNNISELVHNWIGCSNTLWKSGFLRRPNGAYDYVQVNALLFRALVSNRMERALNATSLESLLPRLCVKYFRNIEEKRQVCTIQKAGNIYCQTENVFMKKEVRYKIKDIDAIGTMMDSMRYVEVIVENKFVLKSPENIYFEMFEFTGPSRI